MGTGAKAPTEVIGVAMMEPVEGRRCVLSLDPFGRSEACRA